jgi:hypothetical protein
LSLEQDLAALAGGQGLVVASAVGQELAAERAPWAFRGQELAAGEA